jgi:hypothetical protein
MIYSTGSHTKFYHRFHVVWTTKYRYKVMPGEMRERIREIIIQTFQELGWPFRLMGGFGDFHCGIVFEGAAGPFSGWVERTADCSGLWN